MKALFVSLVALLLGIAVCDEAWARRGGGFGGSFGGGARIGGFHSRGGFIHRGYSPGYRGVYVGAGVGSFFLFGPSWGSRYYAPYPAYPAEPLVYIEQPKPQLSYWYFCEQAGGYYPEVKECQNGWIQVVPQASAPVAQSE